MDCTYRLSLGELLTRPAAELRMVGADGTNDDSNDSGGDNSGDNGSDNGSGDDDKAKDKGTQPDAKDKKIAALEDEKQRHYDLRLKAEGDLKKANDRIAELEKNGTTDEDTKRKLADLERSNENKDVVIGDLRLENEFLKSNKYRWVKPAAALKLADLSKVTIDEKSGSVFGLDDALKALAEDSPFLLLQDDDKDDKKDDDKGEKPKRRTGTPPADKGTQDDKSKQATESRLRSKYAGLRR